MECRGDGVLCGAVRAVTKLVWVVHRRESGDNVNSVGLYQSLEALHYNGVSATSAIIEGGDLGFYGHCIIFADTSDTQMCDKNHFLSDFKKSWTAACWPQVSSVLQRDTLFLA